METGEDWAELAVVTFLNMCTEKELDMEQSVRYLKVQKYKKKIGDDFNLLRIL